MHGRAVFDAAVAAIALSSWETSDELRAVENMPAAGTIATLWKELLGKPAGLRLASTDEIVELLQNADVAASAARTHVPAVLLGSDGDAADFSQPAALIQSSAETDAGAARVKKKMRTH